MEPNAPIHTTQAPPAPVAPKRSLGALIKKHWLFIIIFFAVAITSGVVMAEHEAKTTTNWKTYTSNDAGLSFKHPSAFKIVEDKGWRITVYPSEKTPENNIKILYSHKDSDEGSMEETFLSNCQAKRVSEIDAQGTRIKLYEDNTCGAQTVENAVIVFSENGLMYDIGLFGQVDRNQLHQFLSTFTFSPNATAPTMEPIIKHLPVSPQASPIDTKDQTVTPGPLPTINEHPNNGMTACTMDAMICPDGTTVGRTGPKCEFVCPQ